MFRDTSEELQRLQAELLAEDEPAELPSEEPPEEDDEFYDEYEDDDVVDTAPVYQNYANGYRAYNSDITDEDLEEYSESVREGNPSRGGCLLSAIVALLVFILIGLVVCAFLYSRGYIG